MSTALILISFFLCIILMILLIAKAKVHAVSALLLAVILLGILLAIFTGAGLSQLVNAKGENINKNFTLDKIEGTINQGFANTIRSIAVIIMLGCVLGKVLEETGAAKAITLFIVKVVGKKNVIWAIAISGFILGLPIFSDTVTILLIPIVSNLALEANASMMAFGTSLAVGAQITHSLVAPTPGPVAAAALLGVPLGIAIPWGIVVSIPGAIGSTLWAKYACSKEMVLPKQEYVDAYNNTQAEKLPNTLMSFMPIILPLVLIVINNVVGLVAKGTIAAQIFGFFGSPTAALLSGCIFAMILTGPRWKSKEVLNDWIELSLHSAAMPLFVTGLGGALALFIQNANIANMLANAIASAGIPGIITPIILSVLIHVITGSSTLAVATSAALVIPMLEPLGLSPLAAFLACSSAAMMFKHGNSSAFWVATSLSNMSFTQGLKGVGGGCTVASILCCLTTILLNALKLV
jgi:GntP family gluconate:H+ symporter